MLIKKTVLHSFYAGLGGHTAVFFASLKYNKGLYNTKVAIYGVEDPLQNTIDKLTEKNIPYIFKKKKNKFDIFHSVRYAWIIRKMKADVVFLHGGYGILYVYIFCVIFGRSKILIRETQALNLKSLRQNTNSLLSLLLAQKIVFLSSDYKEKYFNNLFKKIFIEKAEVIPNGLDLEYYSPSSSNRNEIINIGMFSRIVPIKDYKTLIKAFSFLISRGYSNVRLVIAGDGSDLKSVIEYAKDLGIDSYCSFTGLLSNEYLIEYLHSLDIYIHSSLGETMSNSIMQAQSCGLPIIATDVFGINNVITDEENGFLFKVGDSAKLSSLMEELIKSSDKRIHFGSLSRQYAINNLSNELMAIRYNSLFKEMIGL